MPLSPRLGAATLFKLAVPVVDREQRLVSIVTVDDVIDILQQETTEDIYALGGDVHSGGDNYFQMNLLEIARKRVVWLLVLTCNQYHHRNDY